MDGSKLQVEPGSDWRRVNGTRRETPITQQWDKLGCR